MLYKVVLTFWVCGWNPKVWPFKWKQLSSTFLLLDSLQRHVKCDTFYSFNLRLLMGVVCKYTPFLAQLPTVGSLWARNRTALLPAAFAKRHFNSTLTRIIPLRSQLQLPTWLLFPEGVRLRELRLYGRHPRLGSFFGLNPPESYIKMTVAPSNLEFFKNSIHIFYFHSCLEHLLLTFTTYLKTIKWRSYDKSEQIQMQVMFMAGLSKSQITLKAFFGFLVFSIYPSAWLDA